MQAVGYERSKYIDKATNSRGYIPRRSRIHTAIPRACLLWYRLSCGHHDRQCGSLPCRWRAGGVERLYAWAGIEPAANDLRTAAVLSYSEAQEGRLRLPSSISKVACLQRDTPTMSVVPGHLVPLGLLPVLVPRYDPLLHPQPFPLGVKTS